MAIADSEQSSPPIRRLKSLRVAEMVAAELRDRILRGDQPAGSRLPKQEELVIQFGVSAPSVREALRILETERLITVRRGKPGGSEVQRPDAASAGYALGLSLAAEGVQLGDLAEGLLVLEPLCVSLCAQRSDRETVVFPELIHHIESAEAFIDQGDMFTHHSRRFHEQFAVFTEIKTLRAVFRSLQSLWSEQEQGWADSLSGSGEYFDLEDRREGLRAHRIIADDIRRGDVANAARHARRHLADTQNALLDRFTDQIIDVTSHRARGGMQSLADERRANG